MRAVSAAIAAFIASAVSANAGTLVYSNPATLDGDCSFSTTCAAEAGRGDDFAAQQFTIGASVVLTNGDFVEGDFGVTPTEVTWGILADDGSGAPGAILASGTDVLTLNSAHTIDGVQYSRMIWSFGNVGVGLDSGTYYLAIQAISPVFQTYLSFGQSASGAFESHDSGVTWSPGYEEGSSIAVDLIGGSAPEPAAWTMMCLGVGMIGAFARRRAAKA